jgi:hypothetical protein
MDVGTQNVLAAGRHVALGQVLLDGVVGRQDVGKDGDEKEHQDDGQANHRHAVSFETLPGIAPKRLASPQG